MKIIYSNSFLYLKCNLFAITQKYCMSPQQNSELFKCQLPLMKYKKKIKTVRFFHLHRHLLRISCKLQSKKKKQTDRH